jgi:hypothetical protein
MINLKGDPCLLENKLVIKWRNYIKYLYKETSVFKIRIKDIEKILRLYEIKKEMKK